MQGWKEAWSCTWYARRHVNSEFHIHERSFSDNENKNSLNATLDFPRAKIYPKDERMFHVTGITTRQ